MFTMGPPMWGGGVTDPFDALVTLLMRFNSNLTDEKGHAFTPTGSISYVNPDWLGGQAVSVAGASVVTLNTASTDFDFQGDFCLEAAIKANSIGGGTYYVFDIRQGGTAVFAIYLSSGNVGALMRDGVASNRNLTGPALTLGAPYHVALVRQGSTYTLYVNGVSVSFTTTGYVSPAGAVTMAIGGNLDGQIAWARITKGNARYTGTFTTPVEP